MPFGLNAELLIVHLVAISCGALRVIHRGDGAFSVLHEVDELGHPRSDLTTGGVDDAAVHHPHLLLHAFVGIPRRVDELCTHDGDKIALVLTVDCDTRLILEILADRLL
jgi:hypothetical protein